MKLIIFCVECGERVEASFDGSKLNSNQLYREHGWALSLVAPDDSVLAPVCKECLPKIYPPEFLERAKASLVGKN